MENIRDSASERRERDGSFRPFPPMLDPVGMQSNMTDLKRAHINGGQMHELNVKRELCSPSQQGAPEERRSLFEHMICADDFQQQTTIGNLQQQPTPGNLHQSPPSQTFGELLAMRSPLPFPVSMAEATPTDGYPSVSESSHLTGSNHPPKSSYTPSSSHSLSSNHNLTGTQQPGNSRSTSSSQAPSSRDSLDNNYLSGMSCFPENNHLLENRNVPEKSHFLKNNIHLLESNEFPGSSHPPDHSRSPGSSHHPDSRNLTNSSHSASSSHATSSSHSLGFAAGPSTLETPDPPNGSGFAFDCQGDSLSPEHPKNFCIAPVVEGGKEHFYCHLCSFCGSDREALDGHLENHFEYRCDKCDYSSRTEGRLKQHIQRFHQTLPTTPTDLTEEEKLAALPVTAENALEEAPSRTTRAPVRRKLHRCKQCDFTCPNKVDYWNHTRIHMKPEKVLQCPKCEFVTEYKHHLEYHLRNHFGSKPFKCKKCPYSCVNKSMLNSHMKSHTSIYQYRCASCTYATKYCHSLKLHLRKYEHTPAAILNLDGTVEHDTSSLLTMKRSGPKSAKEKAGKKPKVEKPCTQTAPPPPPPPPPPSFTPQTSTPQRFPIPQMPQVPFWPGSAFGRDLPAAASSFSPLNHLMRGMAPPNVKPGKDNAAAGAPFFHKCDECGMMTGSKEELVQHKAMYHSFGTAPTPNMLALFGNMHGERMPNRFMWPRPDMLGMAKAAFSVPPFSQPHPMQLGGFIKAQQQLLPQMNGPSPSYFNGASANHERDSSSTSNSSIVMPPETPLDLTKPNECPSADRKRSRKGKAFKLDALCMRLQEKVNPEGAAEIVTPIVPDDSSSQFIGQVNNQYPSPTESAEESKAVSQKRGAIAEYTMGRESNNNNSIEIDSLKQPSKDRLDDDVTPMESNNNICDGMEAVESKSNTAVDRYTCTHCDMTFGNCAMYTIHMGYHGYRHPFVCNMCGEESVDEVAFFCHIARVRHA